MEINSDMNKKDQKFNDLYKQFLVKYSCKYEHLEFYENLSKNQENIKQLHNENFSIIGLFHDKVEIQTTNFILLAIQSEIYYLVKVNNDYFTKKDS